MLSAQRQRQILDYISANQSVHVANLGQAFGVSLSTIRRDLRELEDRGLLRRVHGGAVLSEEVEELPLTHRAGQYAAEKQRIGVAAAELVRDGETLIITSGTTVDAMISALAAKSSLTVITNSVNVAHRLTRYPQISAIVLGGWLRHGEASLLGHLTMQALHELRADKIFYSSFGIDVEQGLTGTYLPEAQTDRQLVAAARELVVLADHSKFGRAGSVRLVPIEAVRAVVTDSAAPAAAVHALRARNITVIQV